MFVQEQKDVLGRSQALKYINPLLSGSALIVLGKANLGKKPRVTKEIIHKELRKTIEAIDQLPPSWKRENVDGERHAEAFLLEAENLIDILGCHFDSMLSQDDRNKLFAAKKNTHQCSSVNSEVTIIKAKMVVQRAKSESNRERIQFDAMDKLIAEMKTAPEYVRFHLTDEIMGISPDITDRVTRCREQVKFISQFRASFSVAVFKYKRYGSLSDWVVIAKIGRGHDKKSNKVIGFVQDCTNAAPTHLSQWQTRDAIRHISTACGLSA